MSKPCRLDLVPPLCALVTTGVMFLAGVTFAVVLAFLVIGAFLYAIVTMILQHRHRPVRNRLRH